MAVNLTTSRQYLATYYTNDRGSDRDRSFSLYGYYENNTATSKKIVLVLKFESNARVWDGSCSMSTSNGGSASGGYYSWSEISCSFIANYNSQGKYQNVACTVYASSGTGKWGDNETFDGRISSGQSPKTFYFTLPDVDPIPDVSVDTIQILSGGYQGHIIAGFTKLRVIGNLYNAKSAKIRNTRLGTTSNWSSLYSGAITTRQFIYDLNEWLPESSSSNYSISFEAQVANSSGEDSASNSITVEKYAKPWEASGTQAYRCDENRDPDAQGTHGYVKVVWGATAIDTAVPNVVTSVVVKKTVDGVESTLTPIDSSTFASGYYEYYFDIADNDQADISVTLTDRITSITYNDLVVPKQTMPLALYQEGDSVGVAVGRMATSPGFWCYEDFYLKSSDGHSIFQISVDGNGNISATRVS